LAEKLAVSVRPRGRRAPDAQRPLSAPGGRLLPGELRYDLNPNFAPIAVFRLREIRFQKSRGLDVDALAIVRGAALELGALVEVFRA
jgi:hypothetical protein